MVILPKEGQNLNLPRAQKPRDQAQKAGDSAHQATSGKTYRVGKKIALWSDLATYAEVHSLLPVTAGRQGLLQEQADHPHREEHRAGTASRQHQLNHELTTQASQTNVPSIEVQKDKSSHGKQPEIYPLHMLKPHIGRGKHLLEANVPGPSGSRRPPVCRIADIFCTFPSASSESEST